MDDDILAKPRASVATAIAELRGFKGKAGSPEMRQVHGALDHLGYAFSTLRANSDPNPAWES